MTEINRNLDLGLGQVHQCDRVKPFNENPTLPYSKNTDNNRKTAQICFNPKTTRFDCVYLKIAQNVNIIFRSHIFILLTLEFYVASIHVGS